jgi:hypothetical protein
MLSFMRSQGKTKSAAGALIYLERRSIRLDADRRTELIVDARIRRRSAMPRRVAIIQGHPDPAGGHLCHALADAYAQGASAAGHEVARIELARLDFPLLRTQQDFETGQLPQTPTFSWSKPGCSTSADHAATRSAWPNPFV